LAPAEVANGVTSRRRVVAAVFARIAVTTALGVLAAIVVATFQAARSGGH
jgi:hypothetical protein